MIDMISNPKITKVCANKKKLLSFQKFLKYVKNIFSKFPDYINIFMFMSVTDHKKKNSKLHFKYFS